MLGVDNYIVESDNISKLTKAIKDVSFDETEEDKCNQKSEKVRQKSSNDLSHFGGRWNFQRKLALGCICTGPWNRRNTIIR